MICCEEDATSLSQTEIWGEWVRVIDEFSAS
jgi:hypothetical protein